MELQVPMPQLGQKSLELRLKGQVNQKIKYQIDQVEETKPPLLSN